uniref:Uncharacterized protein n=1 Tax=Anopheles albimanus TaxID=7167 RepID=A0A182FK41_ANOAL
AAAAATASLCRSLDATSSLPIASHHTARDPVPPRAADNPSARSMSTVREALPAPAQGMLSGRRMRCSCPADPAPRSSERKERWIRVRGSSSRLSIPSAIPLGNKQCSSSSSSSQAA